MEAAVKTLNPISGRGCSRKIDEPPTSGTVPGEESGGGPAAGTTGVKRSGTNRVKVTTSGVDWSELEREITESILEGKTVEVTWREL